MGNLNDEFDFANQKALYRMRELSAKLKLCKTTEEFQAWEQEKSQITVWVDNQEQVSAIKFFCKKLGIPSPKIGVRPSEKPGDKRFATKKPPK